MQRQRLTGDYLQPSAIFDKNFKVLSAINDPNDYQGPGSGYRLDGERWRKLQDLPQCLDANSLVAQSSADAHLRLVERGPAKRGGAVEVVIALGPAFGTAMNATLGGLEHAQILRELIAGIEE